MVTKATIASLSTSANLELTFVTCQEKIISYSHNVEGSRSIGSITKQFKWTEPKRLSQAQQVDAETQALRTSITKLRITGVPTDNDCTILCDFSLGTNRPVVPGPLRRQLFGYSHNLSHPSARSATEQIGSNFVWHGMNKDIKCWAITCDVCQRNKINRHIRPPTQPMEIP